MIETPKSPYSDFAAELKRGGFLRAAKFFRDLQDHAPSEFGPVANLVGVGKRKAYYLAQVHRVFSELGVDKKRLEALGWTKLKVLVHRIDESNCDQLLELAETCTARQLRFFVRDKLPVSGEKCVVLYFTPSQYAVFEGAVLDHGGEKAGKGLLRKEAALIKALASLLA